MDYPSCWQTMPIPFSIPIEASAWSWFLLLDFILKICLFLVLIFVNPYWRIYFPFIFRASIIVGREGEGKEKEGNISVKEAHQLVASCMCPDPGWD